MAKKEESTNMVERFTPSSKNSSHIDKTTMISVLEESFRNVLAKMFGTDENLDVIMNPRQRRRRYSRILKSTCPTERVQNPYTLNLTVRRPRRQQSRMWEIGEEHTREIIFENSDAALSSIFARLSSQKILDLQKAFHFRTIQRSREVNS